MADAKKREPMFTDAEREHLEWFYKLDPKHFVYLTRDWNEKNLEIKVTNKKDYDAWLNYFKKLPPSQIRMLAATGQDFMPTEGYAALSWWHDIISNPHRITKVHQSGLTTKKRNKDGIVAKALKNDRYGVLCATRDALAEKLERGAGARDTASVAKELTEVMTQIADYEKRLGPKKDTVLGSLMEDMPGANAEPPEIVKKRPPANGGGARNTSFKSRVTIDDLEEDD
jgi:hypothetical protein